MKKYVGSIQKILLLYCWSGNKQYYKLEGINNWLWREDYLIPANENEIQIETEELINLLKE